MSSTFTRQQMMISPCTHSRKQVLSRIAIISEAHFTDLVNNLRIDQEEKAYTT